MPIYSGTTGVALIIAGCVLPLVVFPQLLQDSIRESLVLDSPGDVLDYADGQSFEPTSTDSPTKFVFFNCTNCLDLQVSSTPSTKPAFETVEIAFIRRKYYFDGATLAGGTKYAFKEYTRYDVLNPADLSKVIVQINPIYVGAVYQQAPSETLLFAGLRTAPPFPPLCTSFSTGR